MDYKYVNRLQFQTKDVAEILGCETKKAKKLCEKHGGRWYKLDDRWFIHRVDLEKVLENMHLPERLIKIKDTMVFRYSVSS